MTKQCKSSYFLALTSKTNIKQIMLKSCIISSLAALISCGDSSNSDTKTSDEFSSPINNEIITLSESSLPQGFAFEQDISASFSSEIPYGTDERNVLDIFMPDIAEPTPLIIYVHGGGFFTGQKEHAYFTPLDINETLSEGVAYATINYSLIDVPGFTPGATTPDAEGVGKSLSDVKEALQFLRYNAKSFNIDPSKIAMYGVSAGAGSSLWLALSDDMIDESSENPLAQQSTRIRAAGAIETQGSYDLLRWETDILSSAGFTLETAIQIGFEDFLAAFYGLESLSGAELIAAIREEDGELADFRANLDFPALMDVYDPPLFISNTIVPAEFSLDLNALLHFPTHASVLQEYANASGVDNVSNIPQLGVIEPTGSTIIPFLLSNLE